MLKYRNKQYHQEWINAINNGESMASIAKKYNCDPSTVSKSMSKIGVKSKFKRACNSHNDFLSMIRKNDETGCWEFQAKTNSVGYCSIGINHQLWLAHRYSYNYYNGNIGNLNVLHKCDNRICVNPDHLFLGTRKENTLDMLFKGRCIIQKLTISNVLKIREMHQQSISTTEIAKKFNVNYCTVRDVIKNRTWKHI